LTLHLVDRSALEQRHRSEVARRVLEVLLAEGAFATCHVIALEVLYSARNPDDYERLRVALDAQRWLPVTKEVMDQSLEIQRALARHGRHRIPIPDVMIAATAQVHDASVLHYDRDFDRIAEVTGQSTQWIVATAADA
jgi:predicted nucleic acid-binding protein